MSQSVLDITDRKPQLGRELYTTLYFLPDSGRMVFAPTNVTEFGVYYQDGRLEASSGEIKLMTARRTARPPRTCSCPSGRRSRLHHRPWGLSMQEFIVDLTGVQTYEEFVAAFNEGFCRYCNGHWPGRSWDAFHDFLSWPDDERFRLVFKGWEGGSGLQSTERKMVREILADNPHVEAVFA